MSKPDPQTTDEAEIKPSPYLQIIRDNVGDLIRITEAMGKLKTEEAELTVAKALAYATHPPMIYEGKDIRQTLDGSQPGGIIWKNQ